MSFLVLTRRLFLETGLSALGLARLTLPEPEPDESAARPEPPVNDGVETSRDKALFFLFGRAGGR